MLQQHSLSEQSRFSKLFATLHIGKALRQAGISKSFGLSSSAIFRIVFSLVFEGKNWFRLLESHRGADLPGKDVVYRFLNQPSFAWRRFLQTLSLQIVRYFESLISSKRVRVFIIDDSVLSRNRSKKAELLARVFDHAAGRYIKGYTMLTLGWSDGFSFARWILSCCLPPNWPIVFAKWLPISPSAATDTNAEWSLFPVSLMRL